MKDKKDDIGYPGMGFAVSAILIALCWCYFIETRWFIPTLGGTPLTEP